MIGLNFVSYSKRKIDLKIAKKLCSKIKSTLKIGLFDGQNISLANEYIKECGLNFVQVTDDVREDQIKDLEFPIIKCINLKSINDIERINLSTSQLIIVDAKASGSGQVVNKELLKRIKRPFILAGGISSTNIKEMSEINPLCIGFDVATGIEEDGKQSLSKINQLITTLND
jgi:phosphoribosylanthranilate isomerase